MLTKSSSTLTGSAGLSRLLYLYLTRRINTSEEFCYIGDGIKIEYSTHHFSIWSGATRIRSPITRDSSLGSYSTTSKTTNSSLLRADSSLISVIIHIQLVYLMIFTFQGAMTWAIRMMLRSLTWSMRIRLSLSYWGRLMNFSSKKYRKGSLSKLRGRLKIGLTGSRRVIMWGRTNITPDLMADFKSWDSKIIGIGERIFYCTSTCASWC